MNDREKVLEDLKTLVKMCRSKSDGASLKIEEEEINSKISEYKTEIDEIKYSLDEESYDSASEMADRNIEIILKKAIQSMKMELKAKNSDLEVLKESEHDTNIKIGILKEAINKNSTYIESIKNRIKENTSEEVKIRYNSLIEEANLKLSNQNSELEALNNKYSEVQAQISSLTASIEDVEDKISKKTSQLEETQYNLQNKEVYIDQSKKERGLKKIRDIEYKIQKLNEKLAVIYKDPKYLESKICEIIIGNDDVFDARSYLIELIEQAKSVPYMEVDADNALEDELLRATQARDIFATEIDHKKYSLLETVNPEQIRIDFLNSRITKWEKDINDFESKAKLIDDDAEFNYHDKNSKLSEIIASLRSELTKYQNDYEEEPESNISTKASLKVLLDETKQSLNEAEKIAVLLKQDETEDINEANEMINIKVENLKNKIVSAREEIDSIKARLSSKQSGLTDVSSKSKDKEKLKDLASVVINIKHRRQFAEKPSQIAERLERLLSLNLNNTIDYARTEPSVVEEEKITSNDSTNMIEKTNEVAEIEISPVVTTNIEESSNEEVNKPQNIAAELENFISNLETTVA